MKRALLLKVFLYLTAVWHALAMVGQPLLSLNFPFPLPSYITEYSAVVGMYRSWGFFSEVSDRLVAIEYKVDEDPAVQKFYGRGTGPLDLIRFYRCGACANAAYQFYFRREQREYPWLAGNFICDLHPEAQKITIIGLSALYSSSSFEEFKRENYKCVH